MFLSLLILGFCVLNDNSVLGIPPPDSMGSNVIDRDSPSLGLRADCPTDWMKYAECQTNCQPCTDRFCYPYGEDPDKQGMCFPCTSIQGSSKESCEDSCTQVCLNNGYSCVASGGSGNGAYKCQLTAMSTSNSDGYKPPKHKHHKGHRRGCRHSMF